MSDTPAQIETMTQSAIRFKLSFSEWMAASAFVLSAASLIFTAGVLWSDVRANTDFRVKAEKQQADLRADVSAIDAKVTFLIQLAQEERARR